MTKQEPIQISDKNLITKKHMQLTKSVEEQYVIITFSAKA